MPDETALRPGGLDLHAPQMAELELSGGPVRLSMKVRVTPAGLLAIGGLVSSILLSSAAIVWAATSVPRRHPLASRIWPR